MAVSPAAYAAPAQIPAGPIHYGADYNPEQWDPAVWREDIDLMRRAGVTMVSIGIWSWARIEPRPGQFDFSRFDEVLGLLNEAGIAVDLATPTAAPPAWFYRQHPEARLIEADGTIRQGGSRGICCPHSPAYAEAAARITEAIAAHVKDHPAIAMWHVHNEYGAPGGDCHCEVSQQAFRAWLRHRYGTLAALNTAWGTDFWGQLYGSWEEIGTPRHSGTALNPLCELDYARFTSDSLLARFTAERDIIRRYDAASPITTNLMATNCPANDYWRWAEQMDVVSTDYYLEAADPDAHIWLAMESDLTRSLAGGKPWVLMEHSVSAVSWQPHNWAKLPGEERRNALAHVARGADAILAFQWRQSRRGAEKFHSAMVPHAGTDTRVFREVCELGAQLQDLAELRDSVVNARVALLWDWNSFWAQDLAWRPSVLMRHRDQLRTVYRWLWERGTVVDLVHPESNLDAYDVVIAPASYLLSEAAGNNLAAFVHRGGRFAALPFFAVVDDDECVHAGGAPGPMREVLGLTVAEIRPVRQGDTVTLTPVQPQAGVVHTAMPTTLGSSRYLTAHTWSEDLRLEGAEAVWTAVDGPTPGPVVTMNRYGKGVAVYVSMLMDRDVLAEILEPLLDPPSDRPEVDGGIPAPKLEAVTRHGANTNFVILINHDDVDHRVDVAGTDLLTRETADSFTVSAGGVRVVRTVRTNGD
ncbi:beta-galactosidase [Actinomyces sp. MRS3W]|uniref:beta-galactosidase n=1 Tax=Actinomyces sp. MRS3W TaxID=2800796 RepID=UPI0028FD1DC6|nr:beta-galactosidase [Actinomyces sp. MRS3W]MDU0348037.1 beta-galactosidase [Actinomyces sp. MRS3W]